MSMLLPLLARLSMSLRARALFQCHIRGRGDCRVGPFQRALSLRGMREGFSKLPAFLCSTVLTIDCKRLHFLVFNTAKLYLVQEVQYKTVFLYFFNWKSLMYLSQTREDILSPKGLHRSRCGDVTSNEPSAT